MALLCVGFVFPAATAPAAKFSATLDRDTITLGENAALSLTFEGGSPNDVPQLPPIANLQFSYIGPSSQFSFMNGQTSSTVTHNFQVTPRQAGEYTIPALTVAVNGQRFSTQPLKLRVLKPNAPSPEAVTSGTQAAFLRLQLPKTNVFLGEMIAGELQVYIRQGVRLVESPHLQDLPVDGLSVGKIGQGQQRQVRIGNSVYTVINAPVAFTVVKTGPLKIGPVTAALTALADSSNRRRNSIFEQLGMEDPFSSGERKQITVASETAHLQSLPLPQENVPPGFNGAIGSYSLNVSVGPTNVATGDPITVRVQITGRGSLNALTLPEQNAWKEFKTYPPNVNTELSDQLGLQGTKTFEQIIVPQTTDIKELPAFSFSYFDPEVKAYRTLTQPAVALTVRPGGVTPAPVVAALKSSASNEPPPAQDIVNIKMRPGNLEAIASPLVLQPWFVTAQTVPVVAFIAAFVWRKRTQSLANNPRLRRQKQVALVVRAGLEELRQQATTQNSDAFFATLVRVLQEQIGERVDCPASAITEAVIDEKLRQRGLADDTLNELHELFQQHNLARYAPMKSSRELTALIPRLEDVLAKLREVKS